MNCQIKSGFQIEDLGLLVHWKIINKMNDFSRSFSKKYFRELFPSEINRVKVSVAREEESEFVTDLVQIIVEFNDFLADIYVNAGHSVKSEELRGFLYDFIDVVEEFTDGFFSHQFTVDELLHRIAFKIVIDFIC